SLRGEGGPHAASYVAPAGSIPAPAPSRPRAAISRTPPTQRLATKRDGWGPHTDWRAAMAKLTPRQAAFTRDLIPDMSATEAARKAGYSPSYADRQANQLLEKPQVAAELERLRAKLDNSAIMSAQEVLERLTSIARGEGEIPRSTPAGIFELPP